MATFNGEKFLRPQIESILDQGYSNIEVIVVDDCSTDSTLSILQEYANKDSRIKIYPTEKNMGFIANFERGLNFAAGEYIVLSDQDDIFRSDKVELLLSALLANPERDLVLSDLSLIDCYGNVIFDSMWAYQKLHPEAGKPFGRLIYSNFATGCAMMFTRRLRDLALPFPGGCLVHDWWIALVSSSNCAGGILLIQDTLTFYRQHRCNVIGATTYAPITIRRFLSRFIMGPSLGKGIYRRSASMKADINRLLGYIKRGIFADDEQSMIKAYKQVLDRWLADDKNNLLQRICCINERLHYPLLAKKSLRELSEVVYFSFFPFK
jgi:glycosyltransferase involved in cell wall biosynthesis